MSRLLTILFLIAATSILIKDYCQIMLNNNNIVLTDNYENEGESEDNNENQEEHNEQKAEKETKNENISDDNRFVLHNISLKSRIFSTQYTIFLSILSYKSRCLELESPPPEV